jgi:hypothetical protein
MPRFHLFDSTEYIPPSGLPLAQGEAPLGIYLNDQPSTKDAIVITTASLILGEEDGWRTVPYTSIARVLTPDSKTDVHGLHLALDDGKTIWLPVRGGTEKTFDAFEFLRFINRVLEDRAKPQQDQT